MSDRFLPCYSNSLRKGGIFKIFNLKNSTESYGASYGDDSCGFFLSAFSRLWFFVHKLLSRKEPLLGNPLMRALLAVASTAIYTEVLNVD